MGIYNKFMLYFWLVMSIAVFITVTILGFKEGFDRWYHFYLFGVIALFMFFMKKWMMKRMERHIRFMEEQRKNQNS